MSDDSQGDTSRNRPGESVGSQTGGEAANNGSRSRKRRRRGRRRNKPSNAGGQETSQGAQSGTSGISTPQSGPARSSERSSKKPVGSGPAGHRPSGGNRPDNDRPNEERGDSRLGKRAGRRRRGRHRNTRRKQDEGDNAAQEAPTRWVRSRYKKAKGTKPCRVEGVDAGPHGATASSPRKDGSDASVRKANRTGNDAAEAYAALDLGTNNCRLLIAVPQQPGRFRVIDAFSRIVRLGEGLAATGQLSETAMDRAVGALKACATKLGNRRVRGVRLIATEACRRASNGEAFLHRVERESGLRLEIVDRETEARLAVAGCASLVDRRAKGVVLFDIGGGSSELALLDLSKRRHHDLGPAMVSWASMPYGVVTLSEKHGGGQHVTPQIFAGMVEEVGEYLENFEGRDALASAASQGEIHLLGTSGTVTTLAGLHLNLPRYDRRQVDGIWMASPDVDAMIDRLLTMSFEERMNNPCIGRDRADLVLAGCAILAAIQKLWPCDRLRVADRGLREGLLTEMMNADNAWRRKPRGFRPARRR